MPVDFLTSPCNKLNAICLQRPDHCLANVNSDHFGISDANAKERLPAGLVNQDTPNDFDIFNTNHKSVTYKAIDYCVDIFRTGNYDLKNDNRDHAFFSSDSIPGTGKQLIRRCEGLLIFDNNILFFEIKTGLNGSWLKDAREQFEETILSFREHNRNLNLHYVTPVISNKTWVKSYGYKLHQNENVQKQILMDKIGLDFKLTDYFSID
jgi:hypothetical protein